MKSDSRLTNDMLVSVVIPTYNRVDKLVRALKSVQNQTYTNLEIIVVDDGSTDDTLQALEKIEDYRLKYYHLDQNSGPSKARNFGVSHAHGEYIAFHDDDDEWKYNKIELQMNALLNHVDCMMCFGRMAIYCDDCLLQTTPNNFDWEKYKSTFSEKLLYTNYVGTPTIVIKKTAFDELGGFSEKLHCIEDWEFVIRVSQKYRITYLDDILVDVHVTEKSVTTNVEGYIYAISYIIKRNMNRVDDPRKYTLWMLKNIDFRLRKEGIRDSYPLLMKKCFVPDIIKDDLAIDIFFHKYSLDMNDFRYSKICKNLFQDNEIMIQWMKKNDIDDIAIYGMGKLGKALLKKLVECDMNVVCGIDQGIVKGIELPVTDIVHFNKYSQSVKFIIITPYNHFEDVRSNFLKYTHIKCISIENILEDI